MKYTTKAAEKSTVKITMKFDKDEWKDALNKAYLKTKGRFAVNGFRKGKAPRNVIEHAYGKGVFFEDALNVLFSENYGKILDKEEKKFTAVGDPELSVDDLSDEGVTLVAVTPVKPEVKIGSYKGMKIKEFAYTVKDADIDKELDRLRDRNARKVDVTDRPCQNGDIVNIDFVGTVDGVKFDGGLRSDARQRTVHSRLRGSGRRNEHRGQKGRQRQIPRKLSGGEPQRQGCRFRRQAQFH